jgi:hypothetical protein
MAVMKSIFLLFSVSLILLLSCTTGEWLNPFDKNDEASIVDEIPPLITLIGPDTVKIPYRDPDHTLDKWKENYTVTDNADPNPSITVIADFSVDFPRTNRIQYIATDKSGNSSMVFRYVIILPEAIKDTIKPMIYVPVINIQITKGESFDPRKNVTAFDETDLDLTSKITINGAVDITKAGIYIITYTVKDNSGNVATLIREITVLEGCKCDNNFPVITLIGSKVMHIKITEQYVEPGYSAYDTTDGDITSLVKITNNIKDIPGTYTVTYTVTDKSLKTVTETRIVIRDPKNIIDTIKPVITLINKKDTLMTLLKGSTFKAPQLIISDNRDAIPVDSLKVYGDIQTEKVGTYIVILSVSDRSGNEGQLAIKVTVVDGKLSVLHSY